MSYESKFDLDAQGICPGQVFDFFVSRFLRKLESTRKVMIVYIYDLCLNVNRQGLVIYFRFSEITDLRNVKTIKSAS